MSANTQPIFTLTPVCSGVNISAANIKSDGTGTIGTDLFLLATAGSAGMFVNKIRFMPVATTATSTGATVFRAYLATVSTGATTPGGNIWLIGECTGAAQSAANASTAIYPWEIPIGFAIPSGTFIVVSSQVAPTANCQQQALIVAGNY